MTARSSPPRYAPAIALPPYAYVPGHGHPHPLNDPRGHSYAARGRHAPEPLAADGAGPESGAAADGAAAGLPDAQVLPSDHLARVGDDLRWLHALDLFNEGLFWEAHEAWEDVWHARGRTTPDARFVQGLIHLAAAAVKIREGKPAGVARHVARARELLGAPAMAGGQARDHAAALALDRESIAAVLDELAAYRPECWHTSRCDVVQVLVAGLRPGAG